MALPRGANRAPGGQPSCTRAPLFPLTLGEATQLGHDGQGPEGLQAEPQRVPKEQTSEARVGAEGGELGILIWCTLGGPYTVLRGRSTECRGAAGEIQYTGEPHRHSDLSA